MSITPTHTKRRLTGLLFLSTGVLAMALTTCWLMAKPAGADVVKVGEKAPLFTLKSATGKSFTLKKALGKGPVVLAFFPGAFTPVCTKQLCEYSANLPALRRLKANVIGISADTPATLKRFAKEKDIRFTLLSDPKGQVARRFDSWYATLGSAKRSIVILDKTGVVRLLDIEPVPATYKNAAELIKALKSGS